MAETITSTPKPKKPVASASAASAAAPAFEAPKFEMPKFEMPKFEMPKFEIPNFEVPNMEVPAAFREFAEKGIAQAKDNYEKIKSAAEQATDVLEETYSAAAKGYTDYGRKVIETARTNTNAAFDLYGELLSVTSYAELVEKTTAFARAQFDTAAAQSKELAEEAQKSVTATFEPIKEGFASFAKVA